MITTAASCGAVNAMHDSFTALGGMIPMINMQLGEIIVGGVGAGLYGMLLFVIISIFVAGLMVGRTPEYVGKKIEAKEVKMAMLAILVLPLMYLGWTAVAAVNPRALTNWQCGAARLLARCFICTRRARQQRIGLRRHHGQYVVLQHHRCGRDVRRPLPHDRSGDCDCRIAGGKKSVPPSAGTFPTTGGLFIGLVVGVIVIVGGLTFFPALALGPLVEHLAMQAGTVF